MSKASLLASRVVIGGGIFGCFCAIVLAEKGHDVVLIEQDPELMIRASFVNQARLHTGLHYPRSLITARESFSHYSAFRSRWPEAVRDFKQIYAVAKYHSKTSGHGFSDFIERLGIFTEEIDPERWFYPGTVSRAFSVEEPSFDSSILREIFTKEISNRSNIKVMLNTRVTNAKMNRTGVSIYDDSGLVIDTSSVVLAAYSGTNSIRNSLSLRSLPLIFELTEVVLGEVSELLSNHGFTVMDGPFWSLMPFGHGLTVSLTSVGLTPLRRSENFPSFSCQSLRLDCNPNSLKNCNSCSVKPASAVIHQQQLMASFLKLASQFRPVQSIYTIKTVLSESEIDDARPTLVLREENGKIITVLSGKISTLLDLERELL